MLKEIFVGSRPSHFHFNPVVKALIYSDSFLWSGWNMTAPIFAIFVTQDVTGGSIGIAASAYSVHLIFRVLSELIGGRVLDSANDKRKRLAAAYGIILASLAIFGFSTVTSVVWIYIFYAVSGLGLGIADPIRQSMFSINLDKKKEAYEWGVRDASVLIGVALASALGGLIAEQYGFRFLFVISAIIISLSSLPYLILLNHTNNSER